MGINPKAGCSAAVVLVLAVFLLSPSIICLAAIFDERPKLQDLLVSCSDLQELCCDWVYVLSCLAVAGEFLHVYLVFL